MAIGLNFSTVYMSNLLLITCGHECDILLESRINLDIIKTWALTTDEERSSRYVLIEASVKEAAVGRAGVRPWRLTANRESQNPLHRPTNAGSKPPPSQTGRPHQRFPTPASTSAFERAITTSPCDPAPSPDGSSQLPLVTMRHASSNLGPLRRFLAFPDMGTRIPSVIGSTLNSDCYRVVLQPKCVNRHDLSVAHREEGG